MARAPNASPAYKSTIGKKSLKYAAVLPAIAPTPIANGSSSRFQIPLPTAKTPDRCEEYPRIPTIIGSELYLTIHKPPFLPQSTQKT